MEKKIEDKLNDIDLAVNTMTNHFVEFNQRQLSVKLLMDKQHKELIKAQSELQQAIQKLTAAEERHNQQLVETISASVKSNAALPDRTTSKDSDFYIKAMIIYTLVVLTIFCFGIGFLNKSITSTQQKLERREQYLQQRILKQVPKE
jgi:hypothetical protein